MSIAVTSDLDLMTETSSGEDANADGALLLAFVTTQDELAFAKVVSRHASLVMGICRRVLMNEQDAEDAFQATFLVLARKAGSLRNSSSLPAWLHKTAHRIALRARAKKARRRELPLETEAMVEDKSALQRIASDHERSALDEELNRLPERYRLPVFLCCLEGKSREEAARQLGWSNGSLKGRLERARQMLRRRLMVRGISFSVAALLVMRSPAVAQASVSPGVVASTVQASLRYAAGNSPVGYVSQNAHSLANWSLQAMTIASAKFAAIAVLVVSTLVVGNSWSGAPAVAAGGNDSVIVVDSTPAAQQQFTFVSFLDDDEPRRESDRRRDEPNREQSRRDGDERRETESQRTDRDQPPARETRRDADSDRPREGEQRREGFKPQTDREQALYKMIVQLQREVAELRNALRSRGDQPRRSDGGRGTERESVARDGDRPREQDRDGRSASPERDSAPNSSRGDRWQNTKEGKVFKAYDKNGDLTVTLEEWFAMQEGDLDDARRKRVTEQFNAAEPSGDGKFTVEEFLHWYTKGRFQNTREGGRRDAAEGS